MVVDAKHFLVGVSEPLRASDYLHRKGSVPFGRIGGLADSDYQASAFHSLAIAWSQVGAGGVHVFAQAQSVAGGAQLLRVTGKGDASGFVSDFFTLNVPGAASGARFTWGGITALRDASGQVVNDFAAVSASSGLDYRNAYVSAVPEAPASLMLLAGRAMLGAGWRRGLGRVV